jgi:hypothetical protein
MRSLVPLAGLAITLAAFPARADRSELNVVTTVSPEFLSLSVPTAAQASSSTTKPTIGFAVTAFYGLSNTLHAGVEFHYASLKNIPFDGTTLALSDGSSPTGTLYSDDMLYSATAFALYRMDLPSPVVPVFRLGAGPVLASYKNLALYPDATQFQLAQPDTSEAGFAVTISAGAQYRLGNHWLASASIELRRNLGLSVPWEYALPLSIGYVW